MKSRRRAEIRLYIEGGGDEHKTKARLRGGFNTFLGELRERAARKRIRWTIIMCGGRESTFDKFQTALKMYPESRNFLLVDAEGPVNSNSPWEHLKNRPGDNWKNPGVEDKHCHLMVQTMEAWLIADREKFKEYYGQGFQENALPNNPNVEQIAKGTLEDALKRATRNTKKGEYHKTRHAPEILERIRLSEVATADKAKHCKRLRDKLSDEIKAM